MQMEDFLSRINRLDEMVNKGIEHCSDVLIISNILTDVGERIHQRHFLYHRLSLICIDVVE